MIFAPSAAQHAPRHMQPRREERRRARRGACDHAATVRRRGSYAVQGRVADLTVNGCRVEGVGPFPVDSEMWVRLDGLESLASHTVWSRPGVSGMHFDRPLHPAVVARYLPAASRLTLVGDTPEIREPFSADERFEAELATLAFRAGLMRGISDHERGPVVTAKRPLGGTLAASIRRR